MKRTFKQCDVQNVFVRPVDSNEMPEVDSKLSILS
jgi:hypothetical protein